MTPYMMNVFVDEDGTFGNPASDILDEGRIYSTAERLRITAEIGHDETVFINSLENADVSTYHAYGEVNFAGNAMVGAAWHLAKLKNTSSFTISCQDLDIEAKVEGDLAWIQAGKAQYVRSWELQQVDNVEGVENIKVENTVNWKARLVWAWINESKGLIRARTFATDKGIPEVLGNGSGSMMLADQLGRAIQIKHGEGCVIYARPVSEGIVALGGKVVAI
jgi:predicted PhzF superfamily epimerase YddE/YHI9